MLQSWPYRCAECRTAQRSSSKASFHIYRTLDREEFRLLQVHGYDNYGVLRCSLLRVPFREEALIPYAAISYTWNEAEKLWYGDYDTSQKPVRINGVAVLVRDKVANIICLAEQVLSYICLQ